MLIENPICYRVNKQIFISTLQDIINCYLSSSIFSKLKLWVKEYTFYFILFPSTLHGLADNEWDEKWIILAGLTPPTESLKVEDV